MRRKKISKILSAFLCITLMLNISIPVLAISELDCHITHDENCGYAEKIDIDTANDNKENVTVINPCNHSCVQCSEENSGDGDKSNDIPNKDNLIIECCEKALSNGNTEHEETCPLYVKPTSLGQEKSAVPTGVTFVVKDFYMCNVYANGNAIIIQKDGETDNIYIDANRDGIVNNGETAVELPQEIKDYGLGWSWIFGGSETANLNGDTLITVNSGSVDRIFAGGLNGNVSGKASVNMKGGFAYIVYGANAGTVGNVELKFSEQCKVNNAVYGGGFSQESKVGNTKIIIEDDAQVDSVFGGALVGTTGDTEIIINGGETRFVCGGGYGGNDSGSSFAISGNTSITVNKHNFFRMENDTKVAGGWIYGGGELASTTVKNTTINLNYDESGKYGSYVTVYGAGTNGSIDGNSTINITKNAPSVVFASGYNGGVSGSSTINVSAETKALYDSNNVMIGTESAKYDIFGYSGSRVDNIAGKVTVVYKDINNPNEDRFRSVIDTPTEIDIMRLENSNVMMYGEANKDVTTIHDSLTVGSGSSLILSSESIRVKGDFNGGGKLTLYNQGYLNVLGKVTGKTVLDFEEIPNNSEQILITGPNVFVDDFILDKQGYNLSKNGADITAIKGDTAQLTISSDKDSYKYGETMEVTIAVKPKDGVTADGEISLNVTNIGGDVVHQETKKVGNELKAKFTVSLTKSALTHYVRAEFREDGVVGAISKKWDIKRLPLTFASEVTIPDMEYNGNIQVHLPFSAIKDATFTGYINGDSGAKLHENDYFGRVSSADAGENKKVIFTNVNEMFLENVYPTTSDLWQKYYVPMPQLTINILPKKIKNVLIPSQVGTITYGQKLSDVVLQNASDIFDFKWQNPTQVPDAGKNVKYAIIGILKERHKLNYVIDEDEEGYDSNIDGIVRNIKVSVNFTAIQKDYYVNSGEIKEKIDLSTIMPFGDSVLADGVTLSYDGSNPSQNIKDVVFDNETKVLTYTVLNTTTAIKDMSILNFTAKAVGKDDVNFEIKISTIDNPTPPYTPPSESVVAPKPQEPVSGSSDATATVDNKGNATVEVTDKNIADAVKAAQEEAKKQGVNAGEVTAIINVTTDAKEANTISVNLPKTVQDLVINNKISNVAIVIDKPGIAIGMNLNTIKEMNKQAKSDIMLSATKTDAAKLSAQAENSIGNRPAFDLKATYANGSKSVTNFGTGTVSIAIPYTIRKGETLGGLYAVYVDSKGKISYVTNSIYDSQAKMLRFNTNHFSIYGIGYKAPTTFTDIAKNWAKKDIEYIATRGFIDGKSKTIFAPNKAITKGEYVTALGRIAVIDTKKYKTGSFTDVKENDYFAPYVNWAVSKKIISGTNSTKFEPNKLITREEMVIILSDFAKAMGHIIKKTNKQEVFSDQSKFSSKGKEAINDFRMANIIKGKANNKFDPLSYATRASAATVLRRYIEIVVIPQVAEK